MATQLQLRTGLELDPAGRYAALQALSVKVQCIVTVNVQPVGFEERLHTIAPNVGLAVKTQTDTRATATSVLTVDHGAITLGEPLARSVVTRPPP